MPDPPQRLELVLRDFAITMSPSEVPPGHTLLHARNVGGVPHQLRVLQLPEDLPPISVQLAGDRRSILPPFATARSTGPGGEVSLAVHFEPGQRYAFVCFLRRDTGQLHAQLGMATEFRVHS